MVYRPLFIPDFKGSYLFDKKEIEFKWSSGFADIQKKKNIKAMHQVASEIGYSNVLEVSTKSNEKIGQQLSAFNLQYEINGKQYSLESVYQGSKVFKTCGPFPEIFDNEPRQAKKFIYNLKCGNLKEYKLDGEAYPLSPQNAFYDWLYIKALNGNAELISKIENYDAFTDIEFNPKKQINCQARALASYLSLMKKDKLSEAISSFDSFKDMQCIFRL